MTADDWAALESNPHVSFSSTGSWLESDDPKVDAS
jgi:hypothetical protein